MSDLAHDPIRFFEQHGGLHDSVLRSFVVDFAARSARLSIQQTSLDIEQEAATGLVAASEIVIVFEGLLGISSDAVFTGRLFIMNAQCRMTPEGHYHGIFDFAGGTLSTYADYPTFTFAFAAMRIEGDPLPPLID